MSNIWFTADTHFGHSAMVEHRKFTCVEEMDDALVDAWNEVVQHGDTIWHLGDFSFYNTNKTRVVHDRLKGVKHLVAGNHDRIARRLGLDKWRSISDYKELKVGGVNLVMSHYAFRTWNKAHYGALNLHGHSHGNLTPIGGQLDIGVDSFPKRLFVPWLLDDVVEHMRERPYRVVDHHEIKVR